MTVGSMVQEGEALWAKIQREQAAAEPAVEDAVEFADVFDPPTDGTGDAERAIEAPAVYDAAEAVAALNHEYVKAALDYAASVAVENAELRRIAGAALAQAAEVTTLRQQLGLADVESVKPRRRWWWSR